MVTKCKIIIETLQIMINALFTPNIRIFLPIYPKFWTSPNRLYSDVPVNCSLIWVYTVCWGMSIWMFRVNKMTWILYFLCDRRVETRLICWRCYKMPARNTAELIKVPAHLVCCQQDLRLPVPSLVFHQVCWLLQFVQICYHIES